MSHHILYYIPIILCIFTRKKDILFFYCHLITDVVSYNNNVPIRLTHIGFGDTFKILSDLQACNPAIVFPKTLIFDMLVYYYAHYMQD